MYSLLIIIMILASTEIILFEIMFRPSLLYLLYCCMNAIEHKLESVMLCSQISAVMLFTITTSLVCFIAYIYSTLYTVSVLLV